MIEFLTWASVVVALVIVAVVAYHLVGIIVALKRTADALTALAGGLVKVRDDTRPLGGRMNEINGGLSVLLERLLAVNGNLGAIVSLVKRP